MRCKICDTSDQGLSNYRPDGHFHATRFREYDGDFYCEECDSSSEETMNEMFENDLEEDSGAFDYD